MQDVTEVGGTQTATPGSPRALRLRFSLAVAAVLLSVQSLSADRARHARLVRAFGVNWSSLAHGQLWRLVTDVFVEDLPGARWSILIPFLWVGVCEWFLGWRRTLVAFFVTDLVATVSLLTALRIGSLHSSWAAAEMMRYDCGTSAAIYGALATFAASRRGPNAWICPVLVVQIVLTAFLVHRQISDVQHLVAVGVGLILGFAVGRRPAVGARVRR